MQLQGREPQRTLRDDFPRTVCPAEMWAGCDAELVAKLVASGASELEFLEACLWLAVEEVFAPVDAEEVPAPRVRALTALLRAP